MHVLNHWPDYFRDRNEGLGTTYERFVLHRHFERLNEELEITSLLECPSFGMTGVSGINSMWWATQGIPVTVVDDDRRRLDMIEEVWQEVCLEAETVWCDPNYDKLPFEDGAFDLGWNFAALIFVRDFRPLVTEMTRVVKKAIVICIPNRSNPFVSLRIRKARGRQGLYYHNARRREIVEFLAGLNWRERRNLSFDVPPWPDIAMNKEDLLKKVGLGWLANSMARRGGPPMCILDYFAGRADSMPDAVLRLDWLERLPERIRRYWAHHQMMLFTPGDHRG